MDGGGVNDMATPQDTPFRGRSHPEGPVRAWAVMSGRARRERLAAARLYLVVEARPGGRPAEELVGPALDGGVDLVQLREKEAPDHAVVAVGRSLRALCHSRGALFVLNDRPDLALAVGADGVHVGQEDDDVERARAVVGDDLLVGVSTHSEEQIAAAERSSADYLGVGPVHATATKPQVPAVGLALVRHAAASAAKPFFAIGGIDRATAPEVVAAGARRIAVVRAVRDAADPRAAAAALRSELDRAETEGPGASQPASRSERRDAEARAALVPLREGERPRAVTVGALVALVLGLTSLIFYAIGTDLNGGGRPPAASIAGQSGMMLLMAYGMWRARYWAVLGMEALLGLVIVVFAISAMFAENALALLVAAAVVLPAGALFWFLVKAMARIQMPRRG